MDTTTRQLLGRWQSLRAETGLNRARKLARVFWLLGLCLSLIVVFGLYDGMSPVALVAISVVTGWVIAESNALRSRMAQWPVVARYIDWERVGHDLDAQP